MLLSPFDVRQGTFSGVLVNAVTQSGTNQFRGALEGYGRNQSLTREQPYLTDFRQYQYAGFLGGPIVKDKAFFFLNADVTRQQQPASGPFRGSADQTVSDAAITRFSDILTNQYGLTAGGAGQVQNESPLTNLFGRLDFNLGAGNRLVVRHNFAGADDDRFTRGQPTNTTPAFNLTSNAFQFRSRSNQSVAQLYSTFGNGLSNELILGYSTIRDERVGVVQAPQVTVTTNRLNGAANQRSTIVAGTEPASQTNTLDQDFVDVTNNLTIPLGGHRLTLGTQNRLFKFRNVFGQNSFGTWTFTSLDSLAAGLPTRYQVGVPSQIANGAAEFDAASYSVYAQDEWQTTPRLTFTGGIRAEFPRFGDKPPLNESVQTAYGVRTSEVPNSKVQLSPRVGFNWDVTGDTRNQLRGGVGVFSGSPAYVWLGNAFQNSGLTGYAGLDCNGTTSATTSFATPAFTAETAANPPAQCRDLPRATGPLPGATAALGGAINVIDPDFKFPQFAKASLGFDRRLGGNYIVSVDGLYTRTINDVFYTNLALPDTGLVVDPRGRVLYGTFSSTGAQPRFVGGRQAVLNIENTSKGYTYNLTGGVQRQFANRYSASLFYTYSQARDVASTANSTANSNFALGRAVADTITKQSLGRSRFEQPHRVVATASYSFPSLTDVSFIYQGQSGFAYDFSYTGSGQTLGDLNADGQRNDLVYIPRNAFDTQEIRIASGLPANTPAAEQDARVQAQQAALENFIQRTPCLNEQRGKIMGRNTCRTPWINSLNVRLEQGLPVVRGQRLTLRGEVFNFLNLLNREWGENQQAFTGGSSFLLTEVNKANPTTGAILANAAAGQNQNAVGVFTYDPNLRAYNADNIASNYQVQFSLRYAF